MTVNIIWIKIFKSTQEVASSANSENLKKSDESGKSFINNRNSMGPKIDPCGTPWVISVGSELTSLMQTN